ncbi:werner syndrome ATP-dependent helicase [Trifolium pratense]|uniref:Werner syndrome ATP-dependent helicase n=1 Tax=Trifolium pratense TaxID=57577 RepID=A0A2K3K6L8_TRIPR|nr:werner syndrome ATP-dependent helicase [Trifolium pratense]
MAAAVIRDHQDNSGHTALIRSHEQIPYRLASGIFFWIVNADGFVKFKNPSLTNTLISSKNSLELFIDPLDLTIFKVEYDHDSVDEMIYKILGIKVELREDIRMSNWSQECLTDHQVAYACVQTHCACLAGFKFRAWVHCL